VICIQGAQLGAIVDQMFVVDYERDVKAPLYAKSGIAEYWLVNLTTPAIEVFRQPTVNGYQSVAVKVRGDSIVLSTLTNLTVTVDQLLG
jgi:Uma2 family endonuclease